MARERHGSPGSRGRQDRGFAKAGLAYFVNEFVDRNLAFVDGLQFEVVEFDREDARQAGQVRAAFATLGTPIGPYDVLIAGQAMARGLVLVTHNTREFRRVPGLMMEDWQA